MRKWMALLLALTVLCLCGCAANENKPDNTPTVPVQTEAPVETAAPDLLIVELTLRVAEEGMWADTQAVEELLKEFNAYYPNILVRVEYGAVTVLDGENPDIVLANMNQFAQSDLALVSMEDLSDLWDESMLQDVYEPLQVMCAHPQGGFYIVPLALNPYCMAVNRSMIEDAEAMDYLNTVNHTWGTASFLKVCQALYDNGMETSGVVYCADMGQEELTRLMVTNLYDGAFLDKKTGTYNVAEENMGKALKALAQQEGICFDSKVGGFGAREQFLNGETAWVLNWSAMDQMQNAANTDLLFMHYPSGDSRPETWTEVYGFGVWKGSDPTKVAASRTFVKFMMNNAAAVRATGAMPARESMKDAYVGTEQERTVQELRKLISFLGEKEIAGQYWDTARQEWVKLLQTIGRGGDCEAALEEAQKKLNALFPELFPPETEATTAPTE